MDLRHSLCYRIILLVLDARDPPSSRVIVLHRQKGYAVERREVRLYELVRMLPLECLVFLHRPPLCLDEAVPRQDVVACRVRSTTTLITVFRAQALVHYRGELLGAESRG